MKGYCSIMSSYIWIDSTGSEHIQKQYICLSIAVLFFIFSFFVVGYLIVIQTLNAIRNSTTYELNKRYQIKYLNGITEQYPFD